jgi:uncharacterized membrane protein
LPIVAAALVTELVGVTVRGIDVAGDRIVPPVADTLSVSLVPFTELVKITEGVPTNPVPVMEVAVGDGVAESAIVVGLNEVTAGAASTLKALVKETEPLSSVIDRL